MPATNYELPASNKRKLHYIEKMAELVKKAASEGIDLEVGNITPHASLAITKFDDVTEVSSWTLTSDVKFDHESKYRKDPVTIRAKMRVLTDFDPAITELDKEMPGYKPANPRVYIGEGVEPVREDHIPIMTLPGTIANDIRELLFQARKNGVEVTINHPLKISLDVDSMAIHAPFANYRFDHAMCPVPRVVGHPENAPNCSVDARCAIFTQVVDGAIKEFRFVGKDIPPVPVD